jgi:hypothetical protein
MWGRMGPGGFPGLQNQCDLTTSGWVGSIPARSRHAILGLSMRMRLLALAALCGILAPSAASAQLPRDTVRADTVRADTAGLGTPFGPIAVISRDTVGGPPISPKSAFLRSLLVPGLGQAALDRGVAGGIFVSLEALSVLMALKTNRDLRVARRLEGDSIFLRVTGTDTVRIASPLAGRVKARKQQLEDWVALIIFNHLFAAADAFVAAQLWDVPARVSVERDGDRMRLTATVRW